MIDYLLHDVAGTAQTRKTSEATWQKRAAYILEGCTTHQRAFITDAAKRKSLRCPRRAGKTWTMASYATWMGEAFPGSRILIISLTLGSTKENYWRSATAGIETMNQAYGLGLSYNDTALTWIHQNGSRGILKGADSRADIERIRGATAEADITMVDECKSFAPSLLEELLQDVVKPGLMTRQGTLVLAGTPGLIPVGDFYRATWPEARTDSGRFTNVPWGSRKRKVYVDLGYAKNLWSLHSWSIEENDKVPGQWEQALLDKEENNWADDHPTWRREYLGEWVTGSDGLVYAFAGQRHTGKVSWEPARSKDNPTGLDPDHGPWHLIMGLDLGFEDETAIVLAAYSEQLQELRHVYDFRSPHLTVEAIAEKVQEVIAKFGAPTAIVGDAGGLGKMVIESLNATYSLPIIKAEKTEKFDHIELLNSDFHSGRVKIVLGSDLDDELCSLQWDLSKETKERLVRRGRLREDPKCRNHLCDALLYLWRFSYHQFAVRRPVGPTPGSDDWFRKYDDDAFERASHRRQSRKFTTDHDPRASGPRPNLREDSEWQRALATLRPI